MVDGFSHRAGSSSLAVGMSDREIGDDILVAPGADTCALVRGDIKGAPTGGHRTGKLVPVIQSQSEASWGMALSAMGEGLGQIGTPVPFSAVQDIRLETRIPRKKGSPEAHRPALVERKGERIGRGG